MSRWSSSQVVDARVWSWRPRPPAGCPEGRSNLSWEESIHLDVTYLSAWSPLLDAKILVRTVGAVLRGGGAY